MIRWRNGPSSAAASAAALLLLLSSRIHGDGWWSIEQKRDKDGNNDKVKVNATTTTNEMPSENETMNK